MTSSITGPRVVPPRHAHYAASKAGINGLIRAAALEAAPFGITVNGIEPGNIMTEGMARRALDDLHRRDGGVDPDAPAGHAARRRQRGAFSLSDEAAYITGTTIVIDGGQTLPEGKC